MTTTIFNHPEQLVDKYPIMQALGISEDSLNNWARKYTDFPCVKLPCGNRYRLSEVEAWIRNTAPKKRVRSTSHRNHG